MGVLFGGISGKSRDIHDIVKAIEESGSSICNESVAGAKLSSIDVNNMADEVRSLMVEHYSGILPEMMHDMLQEDANSAAQLFMNNLSENTSGLNESASMPNLVTLTASIATTMRTPYEATLHRLFDTRTLDKQTVEIEEVIPTIRAPQSKEDEDLIDALAPYAPVPFVDRTEINVETLVDGLEPGPACKNLALFDAGVNTLFRINRDVRIAKIDVDVGEGPVDASKIKMAKGSVPYFDAKTNVMSCMFDVTKNDGSIVTVGVEAKIDFDRSVMVYLRADEEVKKVYFYATVSHQEHTHPIYTSFRNNFQQFIVPTRPHIEVSLPQETRTDIANSIQHFANTDIVTAMTENITTISTRMEDQRLKKALDQGYRFEGHFPFEPPANFAYGNLEWFKREFIPFLDQCALKMKNDYNITDCHFRVGVSPYILRIMDTDYSMDKAMTEEGKGAGAINYSIGVKTSTSTFYFISSQQFEDNFMDMLLIPNNFKMSQVKTYNYFKYSSFLTDQLRRSDNHTMPAIVYSERNLPVVFNPLSTHIEVDNMPIMKTEGSWFLKRV